MLYREKTVDKVDCETTLRMIFIQYLFPMDVDGEDETMDDKDDEISRLEAEDLVSEQEDILYTAFSDLITAAVDGNEDFSNADEEQKAKDHLFEDVLMLIAERGFSVHRPMFIENPDTGLEELVEYPYADIE